MRYHCKRCGAECFTTNDEKHSISIDESPNDEGRQPDRWSCSCGADGFDMYDLASHTNEIAR
jgi:hypothetical protein